MDDGVEEARRTLERIEKAGGSGKLHLLLHAADAGADGTLRTFVSQNATPEEMALKLIEYH